VSDQIGWDDLPEEPFYDALSRQKIREHMQIRNKWRWRRLVRDYGWLQREMKRIGLNPEDARFLL
jgi:hypothetical protein